MQEIKREINKVNVIGLKIDKLKSIHHILSNPTRNRIGFQLFFTNLSLDYGDQKIIGIGPEYERLIISDVVRLKFNLNYVFSTKNEPEINQRGTPNSTSNLDHHSHKGIDLNISIPIHLKFATIAPKFGHTNVKYISSTNVYNISGVVQNALNTPKKFNESYMGISLRFGKKYFLDIEPRKYIKNKNTELKLGIGLNIDFIGLITKYNANIYFGGDNAMFFGPMSETIIYGLTFATFLTLVFVPIMYYLLYRVKRGIYDKSDWKNEIKLIEEEETDLLA